MASTWRYMAWACDSSRSADESWSLSRPASRFTSANSCCTETDMVDVSDGCLPLLGNRRLAISTTSRSTSEEWLDQLALTQEKLGHNRRRGQDTSGWPTVRKALSISTKIWRTSFVVVHQQVIPKI